MMNARCLQAIRHFYGLGPEVHLESHLVTRSTTDVERPKRLYFINPGISRPWSNWLPCTVAVRLWVTTMETETRQERAGRFRSGPHRSLKP